MILPPFGLPTLLSVLNKTHPIQATPYGGIRNNQAEFKTIRIYVLILVGYCFLNICVNAGKVLICKVFRQK